MPTLGVVVLALRARVMKALTSGAVGAYRLRMTRGSLAALALLGATLLVTPASDADAQTPGCVSLREFQQVQDHSFTKVRMHRIFETRGRVTRADRRIQVRIYPGCGPDVDRVEVDYTWDGDNAFRVSFLAWWSTN